MLRSKCYYLFVKNKQTHEVFLIHEVLSNIQPMYICIRCSLSSSMSCSEEDSSSRESFMSSDMESINITSDRQDPNHYSRLCQNFSYEPKISRTKKVSFMIGDELLEEELGEDAFHHDYNTSIRNDNYEYEDSIEFPYNADDSWRDIKFLADQLESQVSNSANF